MDAQISLVFKISNIGGGRLAADIAGGRPEILAGEFYASENISVPELVDTVSGAGSYAGLPTPESFKKPDNAFNIGMRLNFKEHSFLLQGSYCGKGGISSKILIDFVKINNENRFWLAAGLDNFTFTDISGSLEGVQDFIGLGKMSALAVMSSGELELPEVGNIPLLEKAGIVKRGLTLRLWLEFADGYLKNLLQINGSCILGGFIPRDSAEKTTLTASIDSLTVLGILTLKNVELSLAKNTQSFAMTLKGGVSFNLPELGSLPEADARLAIDKEAYGKTLSLEAWMTQPLVEPLGIPHTILSDLGFFMKASWSGVTEKAFELYFTGSAEIGSLRLSAALFFDAAKAPALVRIGLQSSETLSISSLIRHFLGLDWPDMLDISLSNGFIAYAPREVTVRGQAYGAGLNARVDTKIFFLPKLTLTVSMKDGAMVAGADIAAPIDLFFVKLYGMGSKSRGPSVKICAGKGIAPMFFLQSGLTVLSQDVGNVAITVGKSQMQGHISFDSGFFIKGLVGFTWDGKTFSLKDCSFPDFSTLDFSLPELDIKDGKCGLKTKKKLNLKAKPQVRAGNMGTSGDSLKIDFSFILNLKSEASAFAGSETFPLKFDGFSLTLDKSGFSDGNMGGYIMEQLGKNIKELAGQAFEQVVKGQFLYDDDNKETLERLLLLLTVKGMEWAAEELISYFICKGIKELFARSLVTGMMSASTEIWSYAGYALAIGGVIGTLINGIFTVEEKKPDPKPPGPGAGPETPGRPVLYFMADKLKISWSPCEHTDYYCIDIYCIKDKQKVRCVLPAQTDTCAEAEVKLDGDDASVSKVEYGNTYHVSLISCNSKYSAQGEEALIHIFNCVQPSVVYYCETERLTVTWMALEGADSYDVRLQCGGGILDKSTSQRSVTFKKAACNVQASVCLRGTSEKAEGPWSRPVSFVIRRLYVGELEGCNTDSGITLKWDEDINAKYYRIEVEDTDGASVYRANCKEAGAELAAALFSVGSAYNIFVRPMANHIFGVRSALAPFVRRTLPRAQIASLICGTDGPLIFCLTDGSAASCQLLTGSGALVCLEGEAFPCRLEFIEKGRENARIRFQDSTAEGAWSDAISLKRIETPACLNASLEGDKLKITWQQGKNVCYMLEIRGGGMEKTFGPVQGSSWETDASSFELMTRYRVFLYAEDADDERRHSDAACTSFCRF